MKNQRLEGMVAATFTPMDDKGNVNYATIESYADKIAASPIKGVFVCGTTGEFTSLTMTERKLILEKWIAVANNRFKVIAHIGSNSQLESVELAAHAAAVGAYAIGSIAPSFFKPATPTDLVNFFVPIAAAAHNLPFYYYHMPAMTGINISVIDFLKKAELLIPNLVGVKYTHNNLMEIAECIHLDNGKFEILHGYDEILIAGLSMGAIAGIGSTYNYIPHVYDNIFNAFKNNDIKTARQWQLKSIEMVEVIIKYGGGVRGGKAVMKFAGIDCGSCRAPFAAFSKAEYDSLKEDLNKTGLLT